MDERYYTLALKYLQRRPRSEKEVTEYLRKKKASERTIMAILAVLRTQKFIDDKEFTRWWIDQRTRFNPKGKLLISLELRQKGISPEMVDAIFAKNNNSIISDEEKARGIIKRINKYNELPKAERYRKLAGLLQRKGFDYSVIYQVLKSTKKDD